MESIWQPEWSPTGDLVFASDRSGWWNLERIRDGERSALYPTEARVRLPGLGVRNELVRVSRRRTDCLRLRFRRVHAASACSIPRPASSTSSTSVSTLGVAVRLAEGTKAVIVAGSATTPRPGRSGRRRDRRGRRSGRASSRRSRRRTSRSRARSSSRPKAGSPRTRSSTRRRTRTSTAPEGELPPLIVESHGGPTGNATADVQPRRAVLDESRLRRRRRRLRRLDGLRPCYRERLNGDWGVVDLERLRQRCPLPRRPG